jgi:uncharacterized membrane protein YkvA (DUF1232 family)
MNTTRANRRSDDATRYNPRVAWLRDWARRIKRDVLAVYLAARDPRVPWYAKAIAIAVAAYAFSPIDLIPDFIPIVGYLDDLILVPLGLLLALWLIPPDVLAECRAKADDAAEKPVSRAAAVVVVSAWLLCAVAAAWYFVDRAR